MTDSLDYLMWVCVLVKLNGDRLSLIYKLFLFYIVKSDWILTLIQLVEKDFNYLQK